jgi:hypothetical protein
MKGILRWAKDGNNAAATVLWAKECSLWAMSESRYKTQIENMYGVFSWEVQGCELGEVSLRQRKQNYTRVCLNPHLLPWGWPLAMWRHQWNIFAWKGRMFHESSGAGSGRHVKRQGDLVNIYVRLRERMPHILNYRKYREHKMNQKMMWYQYSDQEVVWSQPMAMLLPDSREGPEDQWPLKYSHVEVKCLAAKPEGRHRETADLKSKPHGPSLS